MQQNSKRRRLQEDLSNATEREGASQSLEDSRSISYQNIAIEFKLERNINILLKAYLRQ